jgi:hypothetical protein
MILLVVVVATPRDKPQTLLMVYPLWATTTALSFLAHATEAGMYYVVGAVLFGVAVLMALTPQWAPLEVAFFMSANMTIQALYLRKLTQQPMPDASRSLAGVTTVKTPA